MYIKKISRYCFKAGVYTTYMLNKILAGGLEWKNEVEEILVHRYNWKRRNETLNHATKITNIHPCLKVK